MRWIAHGVLFVALIAGVFALLPRLGGLRHDAAGLRHARPAFMAADVTLATFFVSHLTPFGSATGTLVNASTLETEGIAAALAAVLAVGAHPAVAGRA